MTLHDVIRMLESGCSPRDIATDLRAYADIADAVAAGDSVLMTEQAMLLRTCRKALDSLLSAKPMLASYDYGTNSLGNLRAELYGYRPHGVFGEAQEAPNNKTNKDSQ